MKEKDGASLQTPPCSDSQTNPRCAPSGAGATALASNTPARETCVTLRTLRTFVPLSPRPPLRVTPANNSLLAE